MDQQKLERLCLLLGRGNKKKGQYILEDLHDVLNDMEHIAKKYFVEKRFNSLCMNSTWKFIQELDETRKKKWKITNDECSGILLYLGLFMMVLPDVDKKREEPAKKKDNAPVKKIPLMTAMRKQKRKKVC